MIKPGGVLGRRYEVRERIGSGGMADVYKALDRKLNRFVALKVLKPEFRNDDIFLDKFESEAQAAGGLMHPNVVNVYDVGSDQDIYYIVMELVDGITLKEFIEKKGFLSWQEAISIGIQICAGIEAAHEKQIIHRDIKPQNVIISKEGKVKVTDFGIAKPVNSKTVTTNVLGSVHYTSPEQARGVKVDTRSDIYSMGVTLFEMVTGEVPFDGDSAVSVAVKHLNETIRRPSDVVPEVPECLEEIILKCTQKNPSLRYQTMQGLIRDLKRALRNPDGHIEKTMPIRPVKKQRQEVKKQPQKRQKKEREDTPEMKSVSKTLAIAVAVIIGIFVIILLIKGADLFKASPSKPAQVKEKDDGLVEMPYVVGMTKEKAIYELNQKNLGYKIESKEYSDKYDLDEVISQEYKKGSKIKKNTRVLLTISLGKEIKKFKIMDVTNLQVDAAKAALIEDGVKEKNIIIKEQDSDRVNENNVIKQSPEKGVEITENDKVTLFISTGFVEIKDFTGETLASAKSHLVGAGIKDKNISTKEEFSSEAKKGEIFKQSPGSGSKISKNGKITLYVSKGEEMVTVPGLIGLDKDAAKKELEKAGLKLGSVTEIFSDEAKGVVVDQDSAEGEKLTKDQDVSITISKGKNTVSVPEIIGNTEASAINMISNAGLSVVKKYEYNDEYPAGRVCDCTPEQGSEVEVGSTISVTISKGKYEE